MQDDTFTNAVPQIELFELTGSDLPAVYRLECACFTDPWPQSAFLSLPDRENTTTLVAKCGGEILGYVITSVCLDEAELLNLAVSPDHRRHGIGRKLLDAAADAARDAGAKKLWLEVRAANAAARALYRTANFEERGLRRNYYRLPADDAILMSLQLDSDAERTPSHADSLF